MQDEKEKKKKKKKEKTLEPIQNRSEMKNTCDGRRIKTNNNNNNNRLA